MSSLEDKFKRVVKKVIIPLLWFVIVLLLFSIVVISQYTLAKQLNPKSIIIVPFIFFMIYFIWILFVSVTKYKKETLLTDTERKTQWKSLSKEYRRFYKHMFILGITLSTFMILSGIWLIFIKDIYGWLMLFIGANLLFQNINLKRRSNDETKN